MGLAESGFLLLIFSIARRLRAKSYSLFLYSYGREMPSRVLHYWNKSAKMNLISIFRER